MCSKQHYREPAGMTFIAIFFLVFFFVAIVLGPIFGAESRPGFQDPRVKAKPNVWPPFDEQGR
jgi:hypothetical protein